MMGWASYDINSGFACFTKSVNIEAGNSILLIHTCICKNVQNMRTSWRHRKVDRARTAMLKLVERYYQS